MQEKLAQKITLDVREMSVIDVLKFLALKGDVNMVTPGNIQGRATFYLKSVSIQDALDIAVISNRLAYVIEKDIIRIMTEAEYAAAYGKKFNDNRRGRDRAAALCQAQLCALHPGGVKEFAGPADHR